MDVTVCRKLTKKSTLKFGRNPNLTINSLLISNRHYYLRWVYYNCSNINFFDDILLELGITGVWLISKPGCDTKMGYNICKIFKPRQGRTPSPNNLDPRAKERMSKHTDRVRFSKSSLQRRNHGH